MGNPATVYTIGHSTHSIDFFLEILKKYAIDVIVDVRSVPYSQFADQFNQDHLQRDLKKQSIYYLHMGDSLGARHEEEGLLFPDGIVDFEKVQQTKIFQQAIARIQEGLKKGHCIAIMCSEKNPLECHRFSMISRYLDLQGVVVTHILPDTSCTHRELENRLYSLYSNSGRIETRLDKLANVTAVQQSLFSTRTVPDLYRALNKKVGYAAEQTEEFI